MSTSVCDCACLSMSLSVYESVCLSVCLSVREDIGISRATRVMFTKFSVHVAYGCG